MKKEKPNRQPSHILLSEWLKEEQVKHGWLATRVHVTAATVGRWAMGGTTPNSTFAKKIEEITGGAVPADGWAR